MVKRVRQNGFTVTELMVVVTILGVIAGFTIPNYSQSVNRAHERDANTNLMTIHAANQLYQVQNGNFWPTAAGQNLAAINANLGLNIIANGMTYTCGSADAGATYTCTAARDGGAFTLELTEAALGGANPSCSAGTCPTIP